MTNGQRPRLTVHTAYPCVRSGRSRDPVRFLGVPPHRGHRAAPFHGRSRDPVRFLGVPADDVTLSDAVRRIHRATDKGERLHVVTLNPEYVMQARRDTRLRETIEAAGLRVADGVGLTVAARLLGTPLPARITGNDLVAVLADEGMPLFLLGAAPGVAEEAAAVLRTRYPHAQIAGTWAGDAGPGDDAEARRRINATDAKVVLVAYGMPKQDHWIARNVPHLNAPVAIGVGGVFDYLSGRVPRAPRLLRRAGLEWAYRLVRQPWRWRRILIVWQFAGLVMVEAARRRLRPPTHKTARKGEQ